MHFVRKVHYLTWMHFMYMLYSDVMELCYGLINAIMKNIVCLCKQEEKWIKRFYQIIYEFVHECIIVGVYVIFWHIARFDHIIRIASNIMFHGPLQCLELHIYEWNEARKQYSMCWGSQKQPVKHDIAQSETKLLTER